MRRCLGGVLGSGVSGSSEKVGFPYNKGPNKVPLIAQAPIYLKSD